MKIYKTQRKAKEGFQINFKEFIEIAKSKDYLTYKDGKIITSGSIEINNVNFKFRIDLNDDLQISIEANGYQDISDGDWIILDEKSFKHTVREQDFEENYNYEK